MSMSNPTLESLENEISEINFEQIKKKQRLKSFAKGMLFLLPSIVLFGAFLFYPLFKTIYLSFFLTNAQGETTVFVGLQNYIDMFASPVFQQSMKSTFLFVLYTVPTTVVIALFLAVLANEKLKGIGLFRTIFLRRWESQLRQLLYFGYTCFILRLAF